jgi:hypothetical protein
MPPNFQKTKQILKVFHFANTPRAKQEVIKDVKKRVPKIADILADLLLKGKEVPH